ncbi:MAG: DEAD/DEAH box helicase [Promethearchaeota archaeon]
MNKDFKNSPIANNNQNENLRDIVKFRFKGKELICIIEEKNPILVKKAKQIFADFQKIAKCVYDKRIKGYHILPKDFFMLKKILDREGLKFSTDFVLSFDLEQNIIQKIKELPENFLEYFTKKIKLREYQQNAFEAWQKNDYKGVVVLPTGAGKTFVGIYAIYKLKQTTLVVVPTIDLVNQWYDTLIKNLGLSNKVVGKYGGGKKDLMPITITTYKSLGLYFLEFRDKFGLVIFDEVHHLAGRLTEVAAKSLLTPFRLGLTATINPDDEIFSVVNDVCGNIVFKETPKKLSEKKYLAEYKTTKIYVDLKEEILEEYNKLREIYERYINSLRFRNRLRAFQMMIFSSNRDPRARAALKAYNQSQKIIFDSEGKLKAIQKLLEMHKAPNNRILIFSENVRFVEKVSRRFLIPALLGKTNKAEREAILENFRKGIFRIIATGRVLDEGIDVPEANIAIIASGTGVPRQYIQRLGRILRPSEGKKAILYEIITRETFEKSLSYRRHRKT